MSFISPRPHRSQGPHLCSPGFVKWTTGRLATDPGTPTAAAKVDSCLGDDRNDPETSKNPPTAKISSKDRQRITQRYSMHGFLRSLTFLDVLGLWGWKVCAVLLCLGPFACSIPLSQVHVYKLYSIYRMPVYTSYFSLYEHPLKQRCNGSNM